MTANKNYNYNCKYAIITDGLWRKSLSAVRSLGKAGFKIEVFGDTIFTPSFWSRFTTRRTLSSSAAINEKEFGATLKKRLTTQANQKPVLLLMEDASIKWGLHNYRWLRQHSYVLLPPTKTFAIASSKALTMRLAKDLRIPHPQTELIDSWKSFKEKVGKLESGSYILKPCTSSGSHGVLYQKLPDDRSWKKYWDQNRPIVLQERIPANGTALGVSLLMDRKSNCVASFVHQRLQQYPNSGGPSTDRISIHNQKLLNMSIKLLKQLSWQGVAMVEWKVDPRDNTTKLIEINPRFWGSLELAIRSGVDFPQLYTKTCLGMTFAKPDYKDGVRCRWLFPGDILRYITQSGPQRESFFRFMKGLPQMAEEWNPADITGFIATIICTFILALHPKYWKYLRR